MRNIGLKLGLLSVLVLAAALPSSALTHASGSRAAVPAGECGKHHARWTGQTPPVHRHEARMMEHLREAASYFGISAEGKSARQLRAEIMAMKEKDSAKWEAFKKSMKAKRLERLKKLAASHGISVKGKTEHQLRDELRDLCRQQQERKPKPKPSA